MPYMTSKDKSRRVTYTRSNGDAAEIDFSKGPVDCDDEDMAHLASLIEAGEVKEAPAKAPVRGRK